MNAIPSLRVVRAVLVAVDTSLYNLYVSGVFHVPTIPFIHTVVKGSWG